MHVNCDTLFKRQDTPAIDGIFIIQLEEIPFLIRCHGGFVLAIYNRTNVLDDKSVGWNISGRKQAKAMNGRVFDHHQVCFKCWQ
jgi:hypothetical protein